MPRRLAVLAAVGALLAPAPAFAKEKAKDDDEKTGTGVSKPAIVDKLAKRGRMDPPDRAQIHRFRGYILLNKGKIEPAAAELRKSLDQKALDAASAQLTTYSLAQLYTQLGQYDEAASLIDAWFAAAEDPKADAYYLKAMILVQQEKFEQALAPARSAVDMTPQPRESWVQLLAAVYIQLRDYPNVAATLERLVAMSPGKKQYWTQLAAVQHHLERADRAVATLKLAGQAALLEDDREQRQLARLLFLRELPFECAQLLEQGLAEGVVAPDADAYRLMSSCYLAARESEKAMEPLAKAAELSPDADMYVLMGQLLLQKERYAPALDALRKGLAKAKAEQRGSLHLLVGVAQLGSDRLEDAERAFRAAQLDAKVRPAAESYLKYLEAQRALRSQQPIQTASNR
ncbi:MAG: hypothetical protein DCC71_18010 [Proteobacteria bacterium]|nr:MAG: hypothetical protein DCC71_18010 [Pseudomonadota bacterium]